MGAVLGLLANPLIIQLGLALLNIFMKKKELSEQERQTFVDLSALLQKHGIKTAFNFLVSDKRQDNEITEAWKKEQAEKPKDK